jgi:hypothetical protein
LLSELEIGLASSLQKNGSENPDSKVSLAAINTLSDEYSFWAHEAKSKSSKSDENRATYFKDALGSMKVDFEKIR